MHLLNFSYQNKDLDSYNSFLLGKEKMQSCVDNEAFPSYCCCPSANAMHRLYLAILKKNVKCIE